MNSPYRVNAAFINPSKTKVLSEWKKATTHRNFLILDSFTPTKNVGSSLSLTHEDFPEPSMITPPSFASNYGLIGSVSVLIVLLGLFGLSQLYNRTGFDDVDPIEVVSQDTVEDSLPIAEQVADEATTKIGMEEVDEKTKEDGTETPLSLDETVDETIKIENKSESTKIIEIEEATNDSAEPEPKIDVSSTKTGINVITEDTGQIMVGESNAVGQSKIPPLDTEKEIETSPTATVTAVVEKKEPETTVASSLSGEAVKSKQEKTKKRLEDVEALKELLREQDKERKQNVEGGEEQIVESIPVSSTPDVLTNEAISTDLQDTTSENKKGEKNLQFFLKKRKIVLAAFLIVVGKRVLSLVLKKSLL